MTANNTSSESSVALFINGVWCEGLGQPISSISPTDLTLVWKKTSASAEQVTNAVAAARAAQYEWANTPFEERLKVVQAFAKRLQQEQASLANIISLETGKPQWEAMTEVTAMINKVAISVAAQQQRAPQKNGYPGQNQKLHLNHRPHGVMAVFGPYNFPGHLPNGHIVPALLAGNAVVFKPSEETPWTAEKTVALWQQAGLPDGVMNLVQGAREVGIALANAPIDGLLFTGSSTTGLHLHKQFAGRPEVMLALEMGGNNPLIVDKGVNDDTAIDLILQSAFLSAGQRCTCARRLILVEDESTLGFIKRLKEKMAKLIAGRYDDQPEPFMGPIINEDAVKNLLQAQAQLIELGGHVLMPLNRLTNDGCFVSPGLIDMTHGEQVPDEEWFGPLLQVYRVPTFSEAIRVANQTRFGLAAGLISDDAEHQQQFQNTIQAGVISINQPTAGASSELPFGGVGASGNHRPSAYYAADYCAWPQALTATETLDTTAPILSRGIKA